MDAVITWADGTDPVFIKQRAAALGLSTLDNHTSILGARPELRYCLRSLTYNCPWLRTIYLVTKDQWPAWLDEEAAEKQTPPIRRISFRDLHPDGVNIYGSTAVEALLHKIPGLSDLFLFVNSDMFVSQPMKKSDWICDGVGLYKQSKNSPTYTATSTHNEWYERWAHIEQIKLYESQFLQQKIYYKEFHHIQIMSKSAISIAEKTFPELHTKTINSNGRISKPHLGRMLFELIALHLGHCKYDYSVEGTYMGDTSIFFLPTRTPLLCINMNDAERTSHLKYLERHFPKRLLAEK